LDKLLIHKTRISKKTKVAKVNNWKGKVKTEFCHFWLKGLPCENQADGLGCGFAHSE
jgi:hypothetical protein